MKCLSNLSFLLRTFTAVVLVHIGQAAFASGNGLRGDYFNSGGFTNLYATQTNATIDFTWAATPPVSGLGVNYSVRWTGQVLPLYSETYNIQVTANSGVRVWVNDKLLVSRTSTMAGVDTLSGSISLIAGQSYNVMLEYLSNATTNARVQLAWSSPSQVFQVIPQSQLYSLPLATSDTGTIMEEYWLGLAGTNLATLTTFSNYPAKPAGRELLLKFESLAVNWTTNIGTRVSGWVIPQTSGSYKFAVSGSDSAQLLLSSDATTNNKAVIATVGSATGFRQFSNSVSQLSSNITLVGGQKYFIELLQKASTNSTYYSVAWQPPGSNSLSVITGDFLAPNGLHTAQPTAANLFNTLATSRPRLLTSPERFAWLKQSIASNSPAYVVTSWQSISNAANTILSDTFPVYDASSMAGAGQTIQDRVLKLGTAYFVTGNTSFAERAWLEMSNACTFPNWSGTNGANNGLSLGEMGLGMGMGYDWFYDYLTPARRTVLTNGMLTLGVLNNQNQYTANVWYVQNTANNWAMVFNSGSVGLALSLASDNPTACQTLLNSALNSIRPVMGHFSTDNGGYYEGSEYWDYGVTHLIQLLAGVESGLGTMYSLDDTPGFDDTALFEIYNTGPTKVGFDYSDSFPGNIAGGGLTWLSRRFNRPAAAYWRRSLNTIAAVEDILWYDDRGANMGQSGYAPDNYFRGPTATTSPIFNTADVVTIRTKWDDTNASFVGFKTGALDNPHGHLDAGSFVYDGLGRRWITDLGTGNYAYPNYFDATQGWYFYRKRAEGHNTLVLSPDSNPDQVLNGRPPIIHYQSNPDGDQSMVIADLTPAYAFSNKPAPSRVWRGVRLFNNRTWLMVQDEIISSTPQNLWWFSHFDDRGTTWGISADGSSVTLTNGSSRLWVKKLSGVGSFVISNAISFTSTPQPVGGQDDNSNYSKIALNLPSVTNSTITVIMVPLLPGDSPPQNFPTVVALSSWPTNNIFAVTNTPPTANAGSFSTTMNSTANIDLRLLATDAETASGQLRFKVGAATTGTVTLQPDGHSVQYKPPSNYLGSATFNYTVNDRWMDPRLLFYYDLQSGNWTNSAEPNDLSGRWHDGTIDDANAGMFSVSTNAPVALSPFINQSLNVVNSGTSGARLSRGISTAECNLSDTNWTFSGWFRRESQTSLDYVFYIGTGNGLSGTGDELELFCQSNSGDLVLQHWSAGNALDFAITGSGLVSVSNWYHVAVTFTRTNSNSGQVRLYLNGNQVGSTTSVTWSLRQDQPIRFGGHADPASAQDRWFNGELDEIAMFRGALSSLEVSSLTNRTVAHFGGNTVTNTVTINTVPPALPPSIASVSDRNIIAGTILLVTNSASDPNPQPQRLVYSLLAAPIGSSINSNSGVITWRPSIAQSGTSNLFKVVVAQGGWLTNIVPMEDAYVRDGSSSNLNFGLATTLNVKYYATANSGNSRESFLKFAISNILGTLSSAKLQLTPTSVSFAGVHAVGWVTNDSWSEATITWASKPASGLPLATWVPQSGVLIQADVTSVAQTQLAGDQLLSLRVFGTNQTLDGLVGYASREAASTNSPLLVVASTNSSSLSATQSFWVTVVSPQPPVISLANLSGGQFGFTVSGDAGPDYLIQGTSDLASPAWQTLFTNNSPSLPFQWSDTNTSSPQFFYRVILGP